MFFFSCYGERYDYDRTQITFKYDNLDDITSTTGYILFLGEKPVS